MIEHQCSGLLCVSTPLNPQTLFLTLTHPYLKQEQTRCIPLESPSTKCELLQLLIEHFRPINCRLNAYLPEQTYGQVKRVPPPNGIPGYLTLLLTPTT